MGSGGSAIPLSCISGVCLDGLCWSWQKRVARGELLLAHLREIRTAPYLCKRHCWKTSTGVLSGGDLSCSEFGIGRLRTLPRRGGIRKCRWLMPVFTAVSHMPMFLTDCTDLITTPTGPLASLHRSPPSASNHQLFLPRPYPSHTRLPRTPIYA